MKCIPFSYERIPFAIMCVGSNNGGVKKSSLEAVCFAKKLDQDVYSFSSMTLKEKEINILGIFLIHLQ